jgi:hypothetical protein
LLNINWYITKEQSMNHNTPYPELDDEIPMLSLAGSVFMAVVIALFSHKRQPKAAFQLVDAPIRVKVTRRPHQY